MHEIGRFYGYKTHHKLLVLRIDDERIAKIVLQGKVEGTTKIVLQGIRRGKPRTAWMSVVEERTRISLHRAI